MEQQRVNYSDKNTVTPKMQLIATCGVFFILGISFATWASRIPAIRDIANLTPVTLGYVLLAKGIGTVLIMPVVAATIERLGSKKSSMLFGLIVASTLIPMTMVANWKVLAVVLFVTGMGAGGFNVSINALASELEVSTGKSYMSLVHSFFGVGNFIGALIGTGMASLSPSISFHFWGMSVLLLMLLAGSYRYLPTEQNEEVPVNTGFKLPQGAVIWLGVIIFLAAAIEDSISNWVTLFFTDYIGSSDGLAPIGYAAYAGALLIMRLVGDRLKPKYGAQKLLIMGSLVATIGIILSLITPNIYVGTIGFLAAGAGVALTFPMVFSAAGKKGAVALTSVVTMGSLGGMLSQPFMGFLVEEFALFGGFIFVTICIVAVGYASWKSKLLTR